MKALKLHYLVAAVLVVAGMNTASAQRHGDRFGYGETSRASSLAQSVAQDSREIVRTLGFGRGGRHGGGYGTDRGGWDTDRGRHGGFGPREAIQNVREMAQAARTLADSTRSSYSSIQSTKYEFNALQRAHQQAELTKYQIRRAHLVSHLFSSIQRSMGELARIYMQRPSGQGLTRVANRLDQVTTRLKEDIRMDLGHRRYRTEEERRVMQAARQLEADADTFKMIVDRTNGRGRGPRVRGQLQTLKQSMRQFRRASRQAVLSYTATEKLQRVKKLVDRASEILGESIGPGRGGRDDRHGGDDFGFDYNF